MTRFEGYFDGACHPNPGGAMGLGAFYQVNGGAAVEYAQHVRPAPSNSNNVAEFGALQWLLGELLILAEPGDEILLKGDSRIVVNIMNGIYRSKADSRYGPFAKECLRMYKVLEKVTEVMIHWIPREENEAADALSKEGLAG